MYKNVLIEYLLIKTIKVAINRTSTSLLDQNLKIKLQTKYPTYEAKLNRLGASNRFLGDFLLVYSV